LTTLVNVGVFMIVEIFARAIEEYFTNCTSTHRIF
jgi:hypothetical protein